VADVQQLVAQEMGLRNRLKELETAGVDQGTELRWRDIIRGGRTRDKYEVIQDA